MSSVSEMSYTALNEGKATSARAVSYTQSQLEGMTKSELVGVAENLGIEVSSSWTKAVIIQTILDSM